MSVNQGHHKNTWCQVRRSVCLGVTYFCFLWLNNIKCVESCRENSFFELEENKKKQTHKQMQDR